MESFNNWLALREQSENNTVLAVFDFDGTVANVPEKPSPDDDKHHWDGKDWWGSSASLESPFYDGWVNDEVVSAFKKANSNPETHAILLTGRRSVVAPWVKKVLDNIGLGGVEQHFNGDHRNKSDYIKNKKGKPAGDTMSHKTYVVRSKMHDGIREVHFWDDRDDHVDNWVKLAKELKEKYSNLKIVLHKVNPPASRNQKAKIDHINI